jgi:hypothetical protein
MSVVHADRILGRVRKLLVEEVLECGNRSEVFANVLGRVVRHGFRLKDGLSVDALRRRYPILYRAVCDDLRSLPAGVRLVAVERVEGCLGVLWYFVFVDSGVRYHLPLVLPADFGQFCAFMLEFLWFRADNRRLRGDHDRA